MGGFTVPMLVLFVVFVLGWFVFMATRLVKSSSAGHINPDTSAELTDHLSYLVPEGQDPAVIRSALNQAGYQAAADIRPAGEVLTIIVRRGDPAERETVRCIVSGERRTNLGGPRVLETSPVTFLDETDR